MNLDRQYILDAAQKAASGQRLKRYSADTIHGAGFCAQLVRETVEGGLGIPANGWEVSQAALAHSRQRGASVRWATDYEAAARRLGLAKSAEQMEPGDILYWPYRAKNGNNYGHTAIYLGSGEILENSDANAARLVKQGARQPFGKGSQIFVTPLSLRGTPSTVISPTAASMKAGRVLPAEMRHEQPERRWEQVYDPATGKAIPGLFISVKQRGADVRLFRVPDWQLKEEGLI